MSERINIQIIEFVGGRPMHTWYGVRECAYYHHVHPDTLKELIFNGNPLPGSSAGSLITFDLASECKTDLVFRNGRYVFVEPGHTAPGTETEREE